MKKKGLVISLSVFLVFILICTIVAENIYYNNLPQVFTGMAIEKELSTSHELIGRVEYEKKDTVYTSTFNFSTIKCLKLNQDDVAVGDYIYSVSVDEIEYILKTKELFKINKEKENENINQSYSLSEAQKLQIEINNLEIKKIENEIEKLDKLKENRGIFIAETEGKINYLVSDGQPVSTNTQIFKITEQKLSKNLVWQMSQEDGQYFSVGDEISVGLTVFDLGDTSSFQQEKLIIDEISFNEQSNIYIFKSNIPSDIRLDMPDNSKADLILKYTSPQKYKYVVPKTAIHYKREDEPVVYIVQSRDMPYGKEYYLTTMSVSIKAELGKNVALENMYDNSNIVFGYTKEINDGIAVKLKEDEIV